MSREDIMSTEEFKKVSKGKTNWEALKAMSHEEAYKRALKDPDCPPQTEEQLKNFQPFHGRGGARKGAGRKTKSPVSSVRIDESMLTALRKLGNPRDLIEQAVSEKYGV